MSKTYAERYFELISARNNVEDALRAMCEVRDLSASGSDAWTDADLIVGLLRGMQSRLKASVGMDDEQP